MNSWCTVYPKKYAHGFCFAVLCCGYTLTDFPISIRLTSLALWQSNDCPSASKATLMNMDKYFMWIHYERLHNHNKAKHNKTVCLFLGIYCSIAIVKSYKLKILPNGQIFMHFHLHFPSVKKVGLSVLNPLRFIAKSLTCVAKLAKRHYLNHCGSRFMTPYAFTRLHWADWSITSWYIPYSWQSFMAHWLCFIALTPDKLVIYGMRLLVNSLIGVYSL